MAEGMSTVFMQKLEHRDEGTFADATPMLTTVADVLRERAAHQIVLKQTVWNHADHDRKPLVVRLQEIPREGPVWPPARCWINGEQFRLAGTAEPAELWWHDLLQGDNVHAPVGMVPA